MNFWLFIQDEIFGMNWLSDVVRGALVCCGLDVDSPIGGGIAFFVFETAKISALFFGTVLAISLVRCAFFPKRRKFSSERTKDVLGRFRGFGGYCVAALLGASIPFEASSAIPFFTGLVAARLSLGVCCSFLLVAPTLDLVGFVLLTGAFGFKTAAVYALGSLFVAVVGGALIDKFQSENNLRVFVRDAGDFSDFGVAAPSFSRLFGGSETKKKRERSAIVGGARRTVSAILIGAFAGAILLIGVPETAIEILFGPKPIPFVEVFVGALAGVPVCANFCGTLPFAEVLIGKGATPGAALAFVASASTLSLSSLLLLSQAMKPRLLNALVSICVVGTVFIGCLINFI